MFPKRETKTKVKRKKKDLFFYFLGPTRIDLTLMLYNSQQKIMNHVILNIKHIC